MRNRKIFWYVALCRQNGEYSYFLGLDRGYRDSYRKLIRGRGGEIVGESFDVKDKRWKNKKEELNGLVARANMNGRSINVQEELDAIFEEY